MSWWVLPSVLVAITAILFVCHRLGWIDLSDKSRKGGSGGGIMGIGDEVFAPTRHEAQAEMDRQSMLPAPAPVAEDGDKGIFHDGPVKITLDADGEPVGAVRSRR